MHFDTFVTSYATSLQRCVCIELTYILCMLFAFYIFIVIFRNVICINAVRI